MVQPAVTPDAPVLLTIEEYLDYDYPDWVAKAELVRGELRLMATGAVQHGAVAFRLAHRLATYNDQHPLGQVFGDGISYELVQLPRTVRVPDASFIRAERVPEDGLRGRLFRFAPDLAIEVISPSERGMRLDEKLYDYGVAGARMVWLVDPDERTVTVLAPGIPGRLLREGDTLDGGEVVPGFTCAVADIFAGIAPAE